MGGGKPRDKIYPFFTVLKTRQITDGGTRFIILQSVLMTARRKNEFKVFEIKKKSLTVKDES